MNNPNNRVAVEPAQLVDVERAVASRQIFVDDNLFELEMERIFTRCWLFVGFESEIPAPGDYVTRNMGLDPVIMMRDQAGKIGVFHNSCPHRGLMVCQADQGNAKALVCAYHGWTFGMDGTNLAAFHPREFYRDTVPFDKLGLHAVAQLETYAGMVFATWNPDLGPLSETITDTTRWYLDMLMARTPAGTEVLGPPQRWMADQNWKIGSINFCGDGAHAPMLHRVVGNLLGESPEQFMSAMMGDSPDINIGSGHNMLLNMLPGEETPFIGYPEELLPLYRQQMDSDQQSILGRMMTSVFTLFPNLSLTQLPVRFEADQEPYNFIMVRVWQPISATRSEVWTWFVAESEATPEWKAASLRAGTRSFSASGTFDQDDAEAWAATTRGIRGPIGRSLDLNFQTVLGYQDDLWEEFPGPGKTYRNMYTECTEFEYLTEWKRWMEAKL